MSKELSRLEEVELREIWPDEAQDFTPWLAEEENLILLGETLNMVFELENQKINVGDFRADILCRDTADGSRVLIENQLERTNHSHLGQILTYAAGLDIHTVIWIAREFREEHQAALDRLNEITDEHYQYFGIEVKVWQIGDSARAPQFDVVSSPNNWSRTVSRGPELAASKDLSERGARNIKFWTALRKYMDQKNSSLKFPKPGPSNYLQFGMGRTHFDMQPYLVATKSEIGIRLYVGGKDAKNATAYFHLLKEQQEEIQNAFGEPLEWDEQAGPIVKRISLRKGDTDPTDEAGWTNQHEWFASKLELFDKVFRQRIKALNADDWEPPEDADDE